MDLDTSGLDAESRQVLQSILKPAIRLAPMDFGQNASSSFLGAVPTLPEGMSWPTGALGKSITFLGQINLADAPHLGGVPLPSEGYLYFFRDSLGGDVPLHERHSGVFFEADPAKVTSREAEIPPDLAHHGVLGEDMRHFGSTVSGGPYGGAGPVDAPRVLYPKIPLRL